MTTIIKHEAKSVIHNRQKSIKRDAVLSLLRIMSYSKHKMAEYAYTNTTFYKELYEKAKNEYKKIRNVPFNKLPLVKKETVNEHLPFDLLSQKLADKAFKYAETTGSTGSPTPSFFTPKEFRGSVALSKITPFKNELKKVLKTNRNAVCGLACGFTIAGLSFQQILDSQGFLTINVDARSTIAPAHRVARLLTRFKPSVIVSNETDFLSWMRVVKDIYPGEYQSVVDNLKVLLSTAELCSESRSAAISREFDIIHIDNYACVEGYFSLACPCGEKHILPIYHAEVLSEDLTSTNEYGTGRFAFTNLYRKSTPFVRYLLDDWATIYKSDCPYGFTKSIQPHGRYELTVKINDTRYGVRHFEDILFNYALFGEYRVEVNTDELHITAERYTEGVIPVDEIKRVCERTFKLPTTITVVDYGDIRSYTEIRKSKPLLRLVDNRIFSTQKIPEYL